ncbi:sel1 repeat family protein [Vibrio sp. SCSIO 43135]|uniref:sel1 repeat family protein n=1 Tax=Vibrio sp. SCSIO 43135 TaxID=2819096 RepID=UPI002075392C|nr:sel1 repeat family protein [Vibrio sp. SCSIO 43135]USD43447.1 sel1 repeat family protein [Vibrio sp. SCSIO 43135]
MKKIILLISLMSCFASAKSSIEDGITLFNQKEYDQAQAIFTQYSEQGSAYATFWLGVTQYKNRQQFEAGQTFLKAAEMGSPWAMGVLAGGKFYANTPCDFLGWPCDEEKWRDKALDGWEKQSLAGNGKATYALKISRREWWEYIPFYRQNRYAEIVPKAVAEGGYEFLEYNVYWDSANISDSVKMAAEQGYAPAMVSMYYLLADINYNEAKKWANKAIDLGYAPAAKALYFTYSQGEKTIQSDEIKAYYYNRLLEELGGDADSREYVTREPVFDEYDRVVRDKEGNPVYKILVTEQEQAEMDKQVEERVKDIKPNMFLDETSIDLF